MKRGLWIVAVAVVAMGAAITRVDFAPLAPVRLVKPNGQIFGYGYGASTNAARGAAFDSALSSASVGDTIEVDATATTSGTVRKSGVRIIVAPAASLSTTSTVPAVTIDDVTPTTVLYRSRQAELYKPEPEFALYEDNFATGNEEGTRRFAGSGTPTFTVGNGKAVYASPGGGTTSGSVITSSRLRHAQMVAIVQVEDLNASEGATFNDLLVGFTTTTTSSSNTVQYKFGGLLRRTESTYSLRCHYEWSGGVVETTPVTITDAAPFKIVYVQNHNSGSVWIAKNGHFRKVDDQEIPVARLDLEDQATVAKLLPLLYFQSDGVESCTLTDWSVRTMGSLSEREHMVARYDNGEPIKDPTGKCFYVSCDDCGPNQADASSPIANSAFMRNHHCMHLYDPVTRKFCGTTACYAMKLSGRVFGTQEGFVLCDRQTGLWHYYCAEWNISGGAAVKLYHGTSPTSLCTAGDKVFEEGELTQIDLSAVSGFSGQAVYSFNVWRQPSTGTWYASGIRTDATYGRVVYLISDDNPEFSSPSLEWAGDYIAEGGYFWHIGPQTYVSAGNGSNNVKVHSLAGTVVKTYTGLPGGGGYDQFMDCLPWVNNGKTQYQMISFSDYLGRGVGQHGEDFQAGADYENLAFGPRIVLDGGTFSGEQFTSHPSQPATAP